MGVSGLHLELGVRGEQALVANFYAADVAIGVAFRESVERWAALVVEVTQATCAVDTGFMRDHVRAWFSASGLVFEVGWDASDFFAEGLAFYPWFVEFGTRFMAAQPALLPAWDYALPIGLAEIGDHVGAAVERRALSGGGVLT